MILGIARRPLYVVGALYALFVWAAGEGFGGPYALGVSTDVGAAPIYAFVCACLFMLDARDNAIVLSSQRITVDANRSGDPRLAQAQFDEVAALDEVRKQGGGLRS